MAKKARRGWTFTEASKLCEKKTSKSYQNIARPPNPTGSDKIVTLEHFQVNPSEQKAMEILSSTIFEHIVLKESSLPANTFCGMTLPNVPDAHFSNVVYMSIVDLHADTHEAMEVVVSKLHKEYGIGYIGSI